MSQYETLPIYAACYEFLLRMMHVVTHFPREYKYTLGERIQNASIHTAVFRKEALSMRQSTFLTYTRHAFLLKNMIT